MRIVPQVMRISIAIISLVISSCASFHRNIDTNPCAGPCSDDLSPCHLEQGQCHPDKIWTVRK